MTFDLDIPFAKGFRGHSEFQAQDHREENKKEGVDTCIRLTQSCLRTQTIGYYGSYWYNSSDREHLWGLMVQLGC